MFEYLDRQPPQTPAQKKQAQDQAREWIRSPHAPPEIHGAIHIEGTRIVMEISQETDDLLRFMREQGIEYENPVIVLCG